MSKGLRKTFLPPSPMHQPVEFEALVDEYLDSLYEEEFDYSGYSRVNIPDSHGAPLWMIEMARAIMLSAYEYVDDGSDPIPLLEIGNSELDFIGHFVDDLKNGIPE